MILSAEVPTGVERQRPTEWVLPAESAGLTLDAGGISPRQLPQVSRLTAAGPTRRKPVPRAVAPELRRLSSGVRPAREYPAVRLRSFGDLNWPVAWQRVRHWHQVDRPDIPDRLPAELIHRLYAEAGPPPPGRHHHLYPVYLVRGSKRSGLARMFARISTSDLVVYQALVDALAPDLEAHLPGRDVVFSSRQGPPEANDPFEGTPGRPAFNERLRSIGRDHDFLPGPDHRNSPPW